MSDGGAGTKTKHPDLTYTAPPVRDIKFPADWDQRMAEAEKAGAAQPAPGQNRPG